MSDYYDVLLDYQTLSKDPEWDSVCWMPLAECPGGHITAAQKLENPISSAERTVDLELRNAGMQRKSDWYDAAAKAKGYANMEALHAGEKTEPVPEPEPS